jgi:allantoicase
MSKNFNLNVHNVTSIKLGALKEHVSSRDFYASRDIIITTEEGTFEINLFAKHGTDEEVVEQLEIRL